ncbi:MAG: 5-formyltetrahydrofolate cyclo-ligase [Peptoniphilaceae bacterium]|nr:5-formyltetrahydrofolate cyclo-ligase [Peptoniphilaceae bacterium]MDD7383941.1 5-formyltetrahydrofolate cyclo-ligase [Peptoniphilaceae bacterium]MDY3738084.1 5-formyltetrahydrofolate cyclo-ligase [Peptoniphilaceae bacterium]
MKKDLRKEFKEKRKNLDKKEKEILDDKIFENLLKIEKFKKAKTVFAYISLDDEINTEKLIEFCFKENKKVYIPYIISNGIMKPRLLKDKSDLINGKYNILTTKNEEEIQNPEITIVPGLCFDEEKYRLGYGGGFYDRFLEKNETESIGLFYEFQKIEKVPINEYDKKLDIIVSDKKIY